MTSPAEGDLPERRPRGRPRRRIDPAQIADAVAELFAEGGYDAVTIERTAVKLSVSRPTLYRSVPDKEHLLGVLFERNTRELADAAREAVTADGPRSRLVALVRVQIDAAIRMRHYMTVFFGGGVLPSDVYQRWQHWRRDYETVWQEAVRDAMAAGVLHEADPVVATRLLLGMCIWVCRWFNPTEGVTAEEISDAALLLLLDSALLADAGVRRS